MSKYEIISALAAGIALVISIVSVYMAGHASNINKKMFKRQGIIDLFMAWQGVSNIDGENLIGPDVVKAANALGLTATLWNHDVIEKIVLYQSYWEPYRNLYDSLYNINNIVPGHNKTCKDMLSSDMTKAYEDMKKMETKSVKQTKV